MSRTLFQSVTAVVDWLILVVCFQAAILYRFHDYRFVTSPEFPFLNIDTITVLCIAVFGVMLMLYQNLYHQAVMSSVGNQCVRLSYSLLYLGMSYIIFSFVFKSPTILTSRIIWSAFLVLALVSLISFRVVVLRWVMRFLSRFRMYERRTVIVGAGRLAKMLTANIQLDHPHGTGVLGYIDDMYPTGTTVFSGLPSLGPLKEIPSILRDLKPNEIVICLEEPGSEQLIEVVEACMGTTADVKIASPLYDLLQQFRFAERYGDVPLVGLQHGKQGGGREFFRRLFDIVLALVAMVILAPVFILVAVAIATDSAGPVVYSQTRIGRAGRPFTFYKFRSMVNGGDNDVYRRERIAAIIRGDAGEGPHDTKLIDESKVTKVGKFIRKTSLDELPQLWNVLRGEMSLVGPRPCLPYEWEHYEDWQKKRLDCMPGCTGVWQVSGRNAISFNDMVILDFYYIQNASFLLDIQLIVKTIPVMLFGKGGK